MGYYKIPASPPPGWLATNNSKLTITCVGLSLTSRTTGYIKIEYVGKHRAQIAVLVITQVACKRHEGRKNAPDA